MKAAATEDTAVAAILAAKMPGSWIRPLAAASPTVRAKAIRALFDHLGLPPAVTASAHGAEVLVSVGTDAPAERWIACCVRITSIVLDAFPDLADDEAAFLVVRRPLG